MSAKDRLEEAVGDLNLIMPVLQEWLKGLPPAQKDLLRKEFTNASHLFHIEELQKKFKDKNLLQNEPLQNTLGLKEETMRLIYQRAYEEHEKKEERKARALFRFLTLLNPRDVDYWMGLGVCYFIEGRIVEAMGVFQIARAVDEKNPEPYFFLSRCYQMMGELKEALSICREAVVLSETAINAPCYHASLQLEKQLQTQIKK